MKYYPIGTVVLLEGGDRPLMIYGRKQIQESSDLIWDYVACLYPEGNLGEDYNIFFQDEEIDAVLFEGWSSEMDETMQKFINESERDEEEDLEVLDLLDFVKQN